MGMLIRILFPLIGYLCVATVITLGAGYGYLRHTQKLDDERMFQIVSLLHGIDLNEIAKTYETGQEEIPREELSYSQQKQKRLVMDLHYQAKQNFLREERSEFDSMLKQLNVATARYRTFRQTVENFLNTQQKKVLDFGLVAVRNQLQNLAAKKQAKPLFVKMIKEDRTDEVILLLGGMSARNRREILRTFDAPDDIEMLYRIQEKMLAGDPEKTFIDSKLKELRQLKQQDNQ